MKNQYTKFKAADTVDLWYKKYKSGFPSDNDSDKDFLEAINIYTGSANLPFNNFLRYNKNIEDANTLHLAPKMINKLPTYHIPDNIVVYRYISNRLLQTMCPSYPPKTGMVIHDKGFLSTTLIRESVNSYRSGRKQNILLVISVPSGTKGTYVGHLKDVLSEYEVILAPNTQLRIDYKIPFCNRYFECTVVN